MNQELKITSKDKIFLLKTARKSIESKLKNEKFIISDIPENLRFKSGCFVTLHLNKNLRGCIGNFSEETNIVKNVADMAISAAFNDPRFRPISSLEELNACEIEISVLSPMIPCKADDILVGRDGIYIRKGFYSGVLLPQVATEHHFDRETFLSHTCMKAGLNPDCWKSADVQIFRFEAIVFSEEILD